MRWNWNGGESRADLTQGVNALTDIQLMSASLIGHSGSSTFRLLLARRSQTLREQCASHFACPTPWDTWDSGPVAPPKGTSQFHHFGEVMTCDAALCQRRCRCGKSAIDNVRPTLPVPRRGTPGTAV